MVSDCSLKSFKKSKKHSLFYKLWSGCKKKKKEKEQYGLWLGYPVSDRD